MPKIGANNKAVRDMKLTKIAAGRLSNPKRS